MIQKSLFGSKPARVVNTRPRRSLPKTKKQLNDTVLELMNRRERQILVHSCIYYHFGSSIIGDGQYDKWSHELYDLIVANPVEFKSSCLYKEFETFDGNTGMGLPYTDPFPMRVAERLLKK